MTTPDDVQLLDIADERWLELAGSHPQASIFHHPAWAGVLAECYGYRPFLVALCAGDGSLLAGLPAVSVRGMPWVGPRWIALPFSDYCQPLGRDSATLAQLAAALESLCSSERLARLEVRWELPAAAGASASHDYVLHTVALEPNPDAVQRRFERTTKQNIRKAEAAGVQVVAGADGETVERYYQLQCETRRRLGVPVQPWRFFRCISQRLLEAGHGFVLLAQADDGDCLAGAVCLHWGRVLTCKYSASRPDSLSVRPNNLVFWAAIQWGCQHGFTCFDMGRTELDNEGLRRYKRGWGAVETPLAYSVIGGEPGPTGQPAGGRLADLMHTVIQRSPPWVCRAAGELLYGRIA